MAERTHGIRSILSLPAIYEGFQNLVGARSFRERFVRENIRARGGEHILDIGCGPAEILDYLPAVNYTGFDPNPRYVDAARRLYPNAAFRCSRVSGETLADLGPFDIAIAMSVLHHLDDDEAVQLFQIAHDALGPGGRLLTIDPCLEQGQSPIARWIIRRDRGQSVRGEAGYRALAERVFHSVTSTVRHDLLRIPYTHCLLECHRA